MIPLPEGIDPEKKLPNSLWTTDTCNQAQALRTRAIAKFKGGREQDCVNHLRNVWIVALENEISSTLTTLLRDSLDEIDPCLRVKTVFSALARAYDKAFSLSANYPKGFGEHFLVWMMEYHPGYVLYHVERARGSRQDMILEAAMAIYMNREVNVEYLNYALAMPGKRRDNILMRNLFILLASPEMAAQSRLLCIVYFAIGMPLRWLAGKTHELKDFPVGAPPENQWCARSYGRVLDTFDKKLTEIIASPSLFLSEHYMMHMFSEFEDELPPFKEYLDMMFTKRSIIVKSQNTGMRVAHFAMAKNELFQPRKKTNRDTTAELLILVSIGMERIQQELRLPKKATSKNLFICDGPRSWKNSSTEDKIATRGCMVTNNVSESSLGGTTRFIELGGTIDICRAGGQSDMKRNGFLSRPIPVTKGKNKDVKKEKGLFHLFCGEIQSSLIEVGMRDAPVTHIKNNKELGRQRAAKRKKEEIMKATGLKTASKKLIHAIYRFEMYNSEACVKGESFIVPTFVIDNNCANILMLSLKTILK